MKIKKILMTESRYMGKNLQKHPTRVNILVETASLFPLCAHQISYFFPKKIEFWRYSTMVEDNFESSTSQRPRNDSKSSTYVEFKCLIDW